jgi:hypothetical protein
MIRKTIFLIAVVIFGVSAFAQTSQKTLAATLEIYAFPQKGQSASQQSQAESDCYNWAVTNVGADPFELQKQSQQQGQATQQAAAQASQQNQGNMGREVVKGAAVGTLIGGISGNEGKGAAYGAAAGAIRGNRRNRAASAQAAQQVEAQGAQAQQATQQQMDNFKKAFSVCLEGKGYTVKY